MDKPSAPPPQKPSMMVQWLQRKQAKPSESKATEGAEVQTPAFTHKSLSIASPPSSASLPRSSLSSFGSTLSNSSKNGAASLDLKDTSVAPTSYRPSRVPTVSKDPHPDFDGVDDMMSTYLDTKTAEKSKTDEISDDEDLFNELDKPAPLASAKVTYQKEIMVGLKKRRHEDMVELDLDVSMDEDEAHMVKIAKKPVPAPHRRPASDDSEKSYVPTLEKSWSTTATAKFHFGGVFETKEKAAHAPPAPGSLKRQMMMGGRVTRSTVVKSSSKLVRRVSYAPNSGWKVEALEPSEIGTLASLAQGSHDEFMDKASHQAGLENKELETSANKGDGKNTHPLSKAYIEIRHGDITSEAVDTIVNAANGHLMHGGGVAGAISSKGGAAIQRESDAWIAQHGPVPTGDVAYTGPGKLPCKIVIHAVGPVYRNGRSGEARELYDSCYNSLKQASDLKLQSISIPAISSGIFGYPKEDVAAILFKAASDWITGHYAFTGIPKPAHPLRPARQTKNSSKTGPFKSFFVLSDDEEDSFDFGPSSEDASNSSDAPGPEKHTKSKNKSESEPNSISEPHKHVEEDEDGIVLAPKAKPLPESANKRSSIPDSDEKQPESVEHSDTEELDVKKSPRETSSSSTSPRPLSPSPSPPTEFVVDDTLPKSKLAEPPQYPRVIRFTNFDMPTVSVFVKRFEELFRS